ncbi:MAG: hypothetical protein DRN49_07175 [Thaumarchaeota archaeon]|nr:MAG: hypothetical protein DRN49_07175 [Nitrososphaerota archaeon]
MDKDKLFKTVEKYLKQFGVENPDEIVEQLASEWDCSKSFDENKERIRRILWEKYRIPAVLL